MAIYNQAYYNADGTLKPGVKIPPTPPPPGFKEAKKREVNIRKIKKRARYIDINYCPFCGRDLRGDKE